ncbi:hypothetical protein GQ600_7789 [Phytophthora cactorum]|nr:hypothetical protein GQ600_7789 [Phytophthora cactorum]
MQVLSSMMLLNSTISSTLWRTLLVYRREVLCRMASGRSLKRKANYGEHPVFSNDPNRKMAIVRGHQRLRYDRVTDAMLLHDTERDYAMDYRLVPTSFARKASRMEGLA